MITKAEIIGIKYGVSKDNKEFTTLCLDITETVPVDKREGMIAGKTAVWGHHPASIVGQTVLCSVDDHSRINDVQLCDIE